MERAYLLQRIYALSFVLPMVPVLLLLLVGSGSLVALLYVGFWCALTIGFAISGIRHVRVGGLLSGALILLTEVLQLLPVMSNGGAIYRQPDILTLVMAAVMLGIGALMYRNFPVAAQAGSRYGLSSRPAPGNTSLFLLQMAQVWIVGIILFAVYCVPPYIASDAYRYTVEELRANVVVDTFSGHGLFGASTLFFGFLGGALSVLLGIAMLLLTFYRYRRYGTGSRATYAVALLLMAYVWFLTTPVAHSITAFAVD